MKKEIHWNEKLRQLGDTASIPTEEPARQLYFIDQCKTFIQARSEALGRPLTACVVTFGCQMNARDSEKLTGILENIGYTMAEDESADLVLYNTCTVRDNANQRVYGRLGFVHSRKKQNPEMIVGLCGCMMQEQVVIDRIKQSYRFVDVIFGTHNIYKLAELLYARLAFGGMVIDVQQSNDIIVEALPVDRKYSYKTGVNIMYGCNNFCTYCIVPFVRGRERSREPEEIIQDRKSVV